MKRWRQRTGAGGGEELAAETEAFLHGRAAMWLDRQGRAVPDWAWLNCVARSSLDDLAALDRISWKKRASHSWAHGYLIPLATELVGRSRGDDATLADLQRRFLWPLELRLLKGSGPRVGGPLEMLALVRTALGAGAGRWAPVTGGYPAPPVGRNLGNGRFNRIAFNLLGPASVARRPTRPPQPPPGPPGP
jgi:hypothetical protein